jgi:hypothetical protein
MNEPALRKWHRRLGIFLVLFIFLQTITGLVLNLEDLFEIAAVTGWSNMLHRGGGDFGTVYRIFLGIGLVSMAASGSLSYYKIRQRLRKK